MKNWFITACLLFTLQAGAQTGSFPPGEYVTNSGWGTLDIKKVQQGKQPFEINAIGANGHICMLEGDIQQGKATLKDEDKEPPCIVTFSPEGSSIDVAMQTPETCRRYCGMRASFDAVYHQPVPGCDRASMTKTRNKFKKLYDSKQFAEAEKVLSPLLKNCQKTLDWLEEGWIRNDLALTQAKQGNDVACNATLKPLMKDAAKTDEAVCSGDDGAYLPPLDCEAYLPIVKAARVNLKWCAKAKNGQL